MNKFQKWDKKVRANPWATHPKYTLEDWRYEVAHDETRAGYGQWVDFKLLQEDV